MDLPPKPHILVVRTDRMGDVILTLPVVSALRRQFPGARISMLLREYTRELGESQEGVEDVIVSDCANRLRPLGEMASELRRRKFDAAVVAYPRFRMALLLFLSGIPIRIGTGYRWYSFLFNRRHFEHRKHSTKSEAAYNLALLGHLGVNVDGIPEPRINPKESDRKIAVDGLRRLGLDEQKSIAILHPGSGGSAHSWRPGNFSRLAALLGKGGMSVVISGGEGEREIVEAVARDSGGYAKPLVSAMTLGQFGAFLGLASVFVSNSTGPLHLAAAVGTPVVGIYPPVRVMSPERWGPLTAKRRLLVPDSSKCPKCHGGPCRGSECMDQITPESVADAVKEVRSAPVHEMEKA